MRYRKIAGCILGLWLLTGFSGCFPDPKGKTGTHIPEALPTESLFRHLMAQTRLVQCRQKGCLAFGNPLSAPSSRFLSRFLDLENHLSDLQDLEWQGRKTPLYDAKGTAVIIYQISGATRIDGNTWLMEGGWFCSMENSRKCLYQVSRNGPKWHVLEIRPMDRCRHVITWVGTTSNKGLLLRRLAY